MLAAKIYISQGQMIHLEEDQNRMPRYIITFIMMCSRTSGDCVNQRRLERLVVCNCTTDSGSR